MGNVYSFTSTLKSKEGGEEEEEEEEKKRKKKKGNLGSEIDKL
jgi:hypothetical protein